MKHRAISTSGLLTNSESSLFPSPNLHRGRDARVMREISASAFPQEIRNFRSPPVQHEADWTLEYRWKECLAPLPYALSQRPPCQSVLSARRIIDESDASESATADSTLLSLVHSRLRLNQTNLLVANRSRAFAARFLSSRDDADFPRSRHFRTEIENCSRHPKPYSLASGNH
jgi:hypothetical protein